MIHKVSICLNEFLHALSTAVNLSAETTLLSSFSNILDLMLNLPPRYITILASNWIVLQVVLWGDRTGTGVEKEQLHSSSAFPRTEILRSFLSKINDSMSGVTFEGETLLNT